LVVHGFLPLGDVEPGLVGLHGAAQQVLAFQYGLFTLESKFGAWYKDDMAVNKKSPSFKRRRGNENEEDFKNTDKDEYKGFKIQELLGALWRAQPLDAIAQAIAMEGKKEKRERKLPSVLVVQLIIALGILANMSSRRVLGYLWKPEDERGLGAQLPSKKSISKARERLGPRPLMQLMRLLSAKLTTPDSQIAPWAYYKDKLKLISLDSTCIEVPNSAENEKIFGRNGTRYKNPSAFPQAQVIGWLECGTRKIIDLLVRPRRRAEQLAAMQLIKRHAAPDQLILWDRGFPNRYQLCRALRERGAHFLIRLRKDTWTKPLEVFPDGTYLTQMKPRTKKEGDPILMRVIEYKVGGSELIRVGTSLIDWKENLASDLAIAYRERWEIETVFDEIKTHQLERPNGQYVGIRAQWPGGVIQEIYGIALAHGMIHGLMTAAAIGQNVDPDRVSFKNALVIVRQHLPELTKVEAINDLVSIF
jgi:hypothetical protein